MRGFKNSLRIIIVTTEPFPIGLAPTNRILTYARGLKETGCIVSIACLTRAGECEKSKKSSEETGKVNGINFRYYPGNSASSSSRFKRKFQEIKGVFILFLQLFWEKNDKKTNAIIYYSTSTSYALILYLVTKLKRIVFLKEESEFPEIYSKYTYIQQVLFQKIHFRLFDGLLLMTNSLIKYFSEKFAGKKRILHVPMTVDYNRFQNLKKFEEPLNYIAYCGSLNDRKDGVDILLNAFAKISPKFPDLHLYLIGAPATIEEHHNYQAIIERNYLTSRVKITGKITQEKVPPLLFNSKLLVLARPNSRQAEGGFPTKLGEYLCTGKPVVVTSVGEIPRYLNDREHVYFTRPNNVDSLVNSIEEILLNEEQAKAIGLKGKEIMMTEFNYQKQAEKIKNFILSFNK